MTKLNELDFKGAWVKIGSEELTIVQSPKGVELLTLEKSDRSRVYSTHQGLLTIENTLGELYQLNVYQKEALTTFVLADSKSQSEQIMYCALGICGEAGEIAEKVKKIIRDHNGEFTTNDKLALIKEMGDVLWYLATLAHVLGFSLFEVALQNILKLRSRTARNTLHGSGDNR